MYLYTRQLRLANAQFRQGMEWAVDITDKVNRITSLNVGLWTPVQSPGLGTLSWGAAVESLADLEDADAKLQADPMFVDASERGAAMLVGGIEDQVAQFLTEGVTEGNPSYVAVVQSALRNGSFQRGVAAGIEIAARATKLGGTNTAFLLSTTGTYGGCAWITSADTLRDLERAEQAVNMNPEFIAYLDDEASGCYIEGATTQAIWHRIV